MIEARDLSFAFGGRTVIDGVSFSVPAGERDFRVAALVADRDPGPVAREGAEPQPGVWPAVEHPTRPGERRVYPGAGSEYFHGIRK